VSAQLSAEERAVDDEGLQIGCRKSGIAFGEEGRLTAEALELVRLGVFSDAAG
jgi:hypothetical protein